MTINPVTNLARIVACALLIVATTAPVRATPEPAAADAIEHLISLVADSELTFVRNGKRYEGADAADHMRKKYEYFDDDIASPEDFIRLAASRSLISGKPYFVILSDGSRTKTADWLGARLLEYQETLNAEQAVAETGNE